MGRCATVSYVVSLVVGVAMLVTGIVVLVLVFPVIFEKKVEESLVLTEGSESAERFEKSPVPSYLSFHLFHVENIDEVNKKKAKPKIIEKGPYVFRQEKKKNITNWDNKFGTVSYFEHKTYHFEEEMSADSKLSDKINHLNFPGIGIRDALTNPKLEFIVNMVYPVTDDAIRAIRGNFIETHTAGQLVFDTFSILEYTPEKLEDIIASLGSEVPTKYAFYLDRNDTNGEIYTVSSGSISLKDFGDIKYFDGKKELGFWTGHCNSINGTDGIQFPPGVDKDREIYVFSSDICRSLKFQYEEDVNVEGIPALRFVVPSKVFADPNKNKDNMCFCVQAVNGTCPSKAGVIPLDACQGGKPVMASSPYFYLGEDLYHEKFTWAKPSKEKHQTYLDIEPITGQVISASKRIQLNFRVEYDERFRFMKDTFIEEETEPTYFPMLWVQEGGTIDKESAEKFKNLVLKPYRTGKWSLVALIIAGTAIILLVAILFIIKQRGESHKKSSKF